MNWRTGVKMMMSMVTATTRRLPAAIRVHTLSRESRKDNFSWKFSSVTEKRYLCLTSVKAFFQIFRRERRFFYTLVAYSEKQGIVFPGMVAMPWIGSR